MHLFVLSLYYTDCHSFHQRQILLLPLQACRNIPCEHGKNQSYEEIGHIILQVQQTVRYYCCFMGLTNSPGSQYLLHERMSVAQHRRGWLPLNHQDLKTTVHIWYLMCSSSPHIVLGSSQAPGGPEISSIWTEYHPNSGQSTKIESLEDYFEHTSKPVSPPEDSEPQWPFRSQADFEFVKLALDAALMQGQVEQLIQLFGKCIQGKNSFNLKSHQNLHETWDAASLLLTLVPTNIGVSIHDF